MTITDRPTERMAPMPAARHAAAQGHHRQLRMTRRARADEVARVVLVSITAIVLTLAGVPVIAHLIHDDLLCAFVIGCWGFAMGCVALALLEDRR